MTFMWFCGDECRRAGMQIACTSTAMMTTTMPRVGQRRRLRKQQQQTTATRRIISSCSRSRVRLVPGRLRVKQKAPKPETLNP